MLQERKAAFDDISRTLAIIRCDIDQHQSISDYALNIHGENFFRDVFNHIYKAKFCNANFYERNAPSIDLIDHSSKKLVQITTQTTKDKITKTLEILKDPTYKDYDVEIFFLIDKSKPHKSTFKKIEDEYGIDVSKALKSYDDLLRDIENLETQELIELSVKYFKKLNEFYTENNVLNLVINDLVKNNKIVPDYSRAFGTVDVTKKLGINNISSSIGLEISRMLDYTILLENLSNSNGDLYTDLRNLVLNTFYRPILLNELKRHISTSEFDEDSDLDTLQILALSRGLSFSEIIHQLFIKISSSLKVTDFNTIHINWIIIASFFELCDIGVKKSASS